MTDTVDGLVERIVGSVLGAMDMWAMYLGETLGWYEALGDGGWRTADDLAAAARTDARYAREWLEQQAVTGLLEVDEPGADPSSRRYRLPPAHREVLLDRDSLSYLAPFVRMVTASGLQMPSLVEAYRSGGGVAWSRYGPDMRTGQADMNRPWYLSQLGTEWFPSVPDLHARLEAGARIADVGCGEGWSSIALALAYPGVTVDGYDVDEPSIAAARSHAASAGVEDRVTFHAADAGQGRQADTYDVVTAFECIHDLPRPVEVLQAMRTMARPDAHVVVMDEKVADEFAPDGDDVERLMYGFSLFICLPDGMSHAGSVGTGTVMRPDTLRGYAIEAGFSEVEVLPIDNDLWRFYRLS